MTTERKSPLITKSKVSIVPIIGKKPVSGIKKDKTIADGGVSSMSGSIFLGDIEERTPESFRRKVSERLSYFPEDPIVITIDSNGGSVYAAFAIIDFIEHIKKDYGCTVITVCTGKAMSAGALILSAGDVRAATENSVVMIHETLAAIPFTSFRDVMTETEEIARINDLMLKILAKNMKTTVAQLRTLFGKKRDVYLTPAQALDIKIIDKIGFPEIKVTTSMEIS